MNELLIPGGEPFQVDVEGMGYVSYCRVNTDNRAIGAQACSDTNNAFFLKKVQLPDVNGITFQVSIATCSQTTYISVVYSSYCHKFSF